MALTRFCRWTLLCRPPLLLEPYLSQQIEVMEKLNYLIQTRQLFKKYCFEFFTMRNSVDLLFRFVTFYGIPGFILKAKTISF